MKNKFKNHKIIINFKLISYNVLGARGVICIDNNTGYKQNTTCGASRGQTNYEKKHSSITALTTLSLYNWKQMIKGSNTFEMDAKFDMCYECRGYEYRSYRLIL